MLPASNQTRRCHADAACLQIDPAASFATAFTQVGLPWGQYLVGLGAVLGIVTGVLVSYQNCQKGTVPFCRLQSVATSLPDSAVVVAQQTLRMACMRPSCSWVLIFTPL